MDSHNNAAPRGLTHALNRAVEHLMGMIDGIVADGQLHDREVQFLRTWLSENDAATKTWPGSLVQRQVALVLEDGVITEAERAHLMKTFGELLGNDFSNTGSAAAEVGTLPIEDCVTVLLRDSLVCHTGIFLFGTRAACERATMKAGGMPSDDVSRKVDYLIIGSHVSPDWAHTSFGRKIQRAAELQQQGHGIEIISERRWIEALV